MLCFGCCKRICPAIQLLLSFEYSFRPQIKQLIWLTFATHARWLDHLVERKNVEHARTTELATVTVSRWHWSNICLTKIRQQGWFRISRSHWVMFLIHFYLTFYRTGETSPLHYPFSPFLSSYYGHFGQNLQDGFFLLVVLKRDKRLSSCLQSLGQNTHFIHINH